MTNLFLKGTDTRVAKKCKDRFWIFFFDISDGEKGPHKDAMIFHNCPHSYLMYFLPHINSIS